MPTLIDEFEEIDQNNGLERVFAALRPRRAGALCVTMSLFLFVMGCATQGDFLRLQEQVAESHVPERDRNSPDPFARIAQLSADVDAMRQEIRTLKGELELARKDSADALEEVRLTRTAIAQGAANAANAAARQPSGASDAAGGGGASLVGAGVVGGNSTPRPDQEIAGYQAALASWRANKYPACIEGFTAFLQAYPTSGYADDAAYWLADCTYKNDEFKRAVVRFNAVVSVYPESPKAPDALYRQGESLLKLGPKFHEAARTVFKRVQKDYPDSERAVEAAQQLERLGPGKSAS